MLTNSGILSSYFDDPCLEGSCLTHAISSMLMSLPTQGQTGKDPSVHLLMELLRELQSSSLM